MRKLKVYVWTPVRHGTPDPERPWIRQVRAVLAAHSLAEARRIMDATGPGLWPGRDYINWGADVPEALAQPGVILWQPLDRWQAEYRVWE